MKKIAVGMGEILWDVFPQVKQLGGAPANFAYHVSQQGCEGYAISAVGDDESGHELQELLRSKELKCIIEQIPKPTGEVRITLEREGIPQYTIREDVAWDNIPYSLSMKELASRTHAICFGSLAQRTRISRDTIHQFIDDLNHQNNPLIIFDVNLRQQFYTTDVLKLSIGKANILKINHEELHTITPLLHLPDGDYKKKCHYLLNEYNLQTIILTCGEEGSYIIDQQAAESFLPTPKVKVVDTVGAGDSFTATFIATLLQGGSVKEAHHKAVEISAYVCTQKGAMPRYLK